LPDAAREQVTVALAMIDALDAQQGADLRRVAPLRAPATRLQGADGPLRCRRAHRRRDPRRARRPAPLHFISSGLRYAGLDITVDQSDRRCAPGHLSRQGPPALRWALYEAAQAARRPGSPDRAYYDQAAERLGGNRACLALARKLLKRSFHILHELGDEALASICQ